MGEYSASRVYYIAQTTYATCWRAAYETMVRYKVGDPKKVYKLPNYNAMCANGIMDSQFYACAKALGLGGIRYHWFKVMANVEHALRNWGPIWVSGFYASGHKHIIVVKGIDTDANEIEICDPLRGYYAPTQGKAIMWPFSHFAKRINPASWSCQLWY